MKKLWIATELFYPDETSTSFILTKIANKLCDKYETKVLCATALAAEQNYFVLDGRVQVERLISGENSKANLKKRALVSIWFSFKIFFKLLFNCKSTDKVFIVTNPVFLIFMVAVAKKIKKFDFVILVHDVFPENGIPAKIFPSKDAFTYKLIKYFFDWSYASSDQLIVLGRDMKAVMQGKINKWKSKTQITIIENWGDTENIFPKNKESVLQSDAPLLHKVAFQYAGNIGRVQGLMGLLENVMQVNNNKIVFQFVGDGAVKNEMMAFVTKQKMKNIFFADSYQRQEQNEILNSADVAIITLADGMFGLGVPSKLYNLLAAGKPILYFGDSNSEIALLIKEYDIGYHFEPYNSGEIIQFFNQIGEEFIENLTIKSKNARNLASANFSENLIINKFLIAI
ncbi:glycosyltransferase family 4 protein [Frigoriflavimonas asaccharolytica]|uniref:Glycosyltransferase involved in cell wall biosynthesis n=1 Tax=Frigoriflavimonas asaccharolytica TaxID=2735899 RepID=A0A8J8G5A1_9FLAO|nr:glycosyltransferase family 4 protein [Frigoriflavimonas asaccharolytica]NRS91708.1 hypothetical protein [Frigoriflavimonas asaccharolytica]